MRDSIPSRRSSAVRPSWARALQRAALLLATSVALFASSLVVGRWIVSLPGSEIIYGDVLLGWIGVVAYVSAWPNLWAALRDFRARQPGDSNGVVAWRAFSLTLVVAVATVVILLLQYHALASADAWVFIGSWSVLRLAGWALVPTLALHGIIFGRVARSLEPGFQYLTDLGALILFAVFRRNDRDDSPEPRGHRLRSSMEPGTRGAACCRCGRLRSGRSRDDRPLGDREIADPDDAASPARVLSRAPVRGLPLGRGHPRVRSRSAPGRP